LRMNDSEIAIIAQAVSFKTSVCMETWFDK
jgi:hypothetical protein